MGATRGGLAAAVLLYGVVTLRTAWLSEDAFITFRTVDNFIQGFGLDQLGFFIVPLRR